mgnify:FL=1
MPHIDSLAAGLLRRPDRQNDQQAATVAPAHRLAHASMAGQQVVSA